MYKDLITENKNPELYILMNGKYQKFYEIFFSIIINILTQENKYILNIETIVADDEKALVNVIKNSFPCSRLINCFFYYKQDLLLNIRKYGLYKDSQKSFSDLIIKILKDFPLICKGDYIIIESLNYIILQLLL